MPLLTYPDHSVRVCKIENMLCRRTSEPIFVNVCRLDLTFNSVLNIRDIGGVFVILIG